MTKEHLEAIHKRQAKIEAIEKERGLTFMEASEAFNLALREFGLQLAIVMRIDQLLDFLTRMIQKAQRLFGGIR